MGTQQGLEARADLADAFLVASRVLVGIAARSIEAAPVEVGLPGFRVLVVLDTRGPQPIGAIAEVLRVHPSNASRLCTRLGGLGLIARSRGAGDGRVVEVSLTERGHEVVAAVTEARRREILEVLTRMEHADVDAAVAALSAFAAAFGEHTLTSWSDPWVDVAGASPGRDPVPEPGAPR